MTMTQKSLFSGLHPAALGFNGISSSHAGWRGQAQYYVVEVLFMWYLSGSFHLRDAECFINRFLFLPFSPFRSST